MGIVFLTPFYIKKKADKEDRGEDMKTGEMVI